MNLCTTKNLHGFFIQRKITRDSRNLNNISNKPLSTLICGISVSFLSSSSLFGLIQSSQFHFGVARAKSCSATPSLPPPAESFIQGNSKKDSRSAQWAKCRRKGRQWNFAHSLMANGGCQEGENEPIFMEMARTPVRFCPYNRIALCKYSEYYVVKIQ